MKNLKNSGKQHSNIIKGSKKKTLIMTRTDIRKLIKMSTNQHIERKSIEGLRKIKENGMIKRHSKTNMIENGEILNTNMATL